MQADAATLTPAGPPPAPEDAPAQDAPTAGLAADLAAELGRHARLMHTVKSHMSAWAPAGLDWAAVVVLMQVVKCGPTRQGELAMASLLDPSTVSRHTSALTRAGLVERRADPVDGRAVQLVATAAGRAAADDVLARRNAVFAQILAGWHADDVRTLIALLARLNDAVEARRPEPASTTSSPLTGTTDRSPA